MKLKKLIMAAIFIIVIPGNLTAQETVRLTNGEWPPFLSEKLPEYGLVSQIVNEAFKLEGITVKYDFFPWKRSYEVAKAGRWDGSVVWRHSSERAKAFYFSDAVIAADRVFFHRKDVRFDWKNFDDLKDVSVGLTHGYAYGDDFEAAVKEKNIKTITDITDLVNFRKLLGKRITVFACEKEVGDYLLRQNFSPKEIGLITYHPKPLNSDPLYLLLNKKNKRNKKRLEIFNRGLAKLRAAGRVKQILDNAGSQ